MSYNPLVNPRRNYKPFFAFCVIFLILSNLYFNYLRKLANERIFSLSIKGVIQKVHYDIKGYPFVMVRDSMYYLDGNWMEPGFKIQI
jgi:hypothetical protein